jgi:hypothetical protein
MSMMKQTASKALTDLDEQAIQSLTQLITLCSPNPMTHHNVL